MLVRTWRIRKPGALWVGVWNGATAVENRMESPQKIKTIPTTWHSDATCRYLTKRIETRISERQLNSRVDWSIVGNCQAAGTAQCLLTDGRSEKTWSVHTVEYHSAIKRKEILPQATTRMNPEHIVLSGVRQPQKDKYWVMSLPWGIWRHQGHQSRK